MNTELLGPDSFGGWRKSSFSNPNGNQCVEVAFGQAAVGLRDSKNPDGPMLVFDHNRWTRLLAEMSTLGSRRL